MLRDRAVAAIAAAPADAPLLLVFTPIAPHGPWIPAERHQNLYPDASGDDRDRLQTLAAVDEAVVAIAAALGRRWDDACVFVLSDNGFLLGEHGIESGKGIWWDGASRVPLHVRCDGVVADGRMTATIDLAPTILRAAGIESSWEMDGRALQDAWVREALLLEGWFEIGRSGRNLGHQYTAVRTRDRIYVVGVRTDNSHYQFLIDAATEEVLASGTEAARQADGLRVVLADLQRCAGDGCRAADGGR